MFLFLSKFLPIFIYPLSLAGMLLLAALLLRSEKWRKRLVVLAFLLIWLGGNHFVSAAVVRSLEWQYLPPEEMPVAEAIVILGGGTVAAEYPRSTVEIEDAGDRVLYGARLFKEGRAPLVVVTGGNLPWSVAESDGARTMLDILALMGIPENAVLLESVSANTYENALYTRELLEPLGITRIILVTSAMHMPRSVPLFENQGFEVIPAPTDFHVTRTSIDKPFSESWPQWVFAIFPGSHSLNELTLALKEYIGIWIYDLRGWL